ncbi:MAG: hypothetical protein IPL56_00690 [Saprospiraceae bacterium]|nr:hypothetical protein [Saprospiraceae bacterium]
MTVLYIGHYDEGSTSGMRADLLKEILHAQNFKIANIDIPLRATNRLFRSLGWRYKVGPLISNINDYIVSVVNNEWSYDLVWIDKGVFIYPAIIKKLKMHSGKLVHFTPDPAFSYHRSKLFYAALPYYDVCVTTKSYERRFYEEQNVNRLLVCTQGFHPDIHKPVVKFEEK